LSGLEASYEAFDVPPDRLPAELSRLFEFDGFNVTLPHKSAVMPYLSQISGFARLCGAVNTVSSVGKTGYNTDSDGLAAALSSAGLPLTGKVAVLGAGGTARTAAFLAIRNVGGTIPVVPEGQGLGNAAGSCEVTLVARNLARARAIADDAYDRLGAHIRVCETLPEDERFDLLINATPVGMFPNMNACPLRLEQLRQAGGVFDAIYNPGETMLVKEARALGIPSSGGMFMLVFQAVAAQKIWYGARFKDADLAELARKAQRSVVGGDHPRSSVVNA
jgi:shikimate dehydrogenase